ncbi:MAG: hypothetical protein M3Q49_01555 [Actinomycetota bacterium]|nr:hypothetical protein [Actinomycetota bacterium]
MFHFLTSCLRCSSSGGRATEETVSTVLRRSSLFVWANTCERSSPRLVSSGRAGSRSGSQAACIASAAASRSFRVLMRSLRSRPLEAATMSLTSASKRSRASSWARASSL